MAKKKDTQELEVVNDELIESTEEVAPITMMEVQPTIKNGYIRIRRKGKEGNGIVISVRLWGVQFKSEDWDILEEYKKK